MNNVSPSDEIRKQCHQKAFHNYGYAYIFKKRAEKLKFRVTIIKALGVIVPAAVGGIALSYGAKNWLTDLAIIIAVPATFVQFILSIWAIVYKWDEELSYCYESIPSHSGLYNKLKHLAQFPPKALADLQKEYEKLDVEITLREQQDDQHNIKEWEERRGMRWSLREHKKECYKCKEQPFSMKTKKCEVCGDFSFFKNQLLNN